MNKKTWYEIYAIEEIKTSNGIDKRTRTLDIFYTVAEAKKEYRNYLRSGLWINKELGIDKWENMKNPVRLGEVNII